MKRAVDRQYAIIEQAKRRLNAIRAKCKHPSMRATLYEWRIGSVHPAVLCANCDAVQHAIQPSPLASLDVQGGATLSISSSNTLFSGQCVHHIPFGQSCSGCQR